MTNAVEQIELLAPAKNLECGMAAVNYGADAVYIGAPKFGARVNAGNTLGDIEQLVRYAHRYRAKVYVTLNTILFDNELDEARALARDVFHAGADALIIQDMALLEMDLPPIPLFASTQTHNYSVDRIKFLQDVGIRRVILARELSLQQIGEIRSATTVELESFVHGALCVSFSGQCYFSQATQGRSANRGECAQSCRMKYSLEDGAGNVLAKDKHLLSLKDLNLSDHLSGLLDAGVTSFKIEGRLKDIDYVKNIVSFYRLRLDEIFQQRPSFRASSSGSTTVSFIPDPAKSFNRGMTQYFIRGRKKDIASFNTPKSLGKQIGTVLRIADNYFEINADLEIANGDGICFFDENDELQGEYVNRTKGRSIYPQSMEKIRVGAHVYRNFDKAFVEALERDKAVRRIDARIGISETASGIRLTAADEDDVTVTLDYACEKTPARDAAKAVETMQTQMKKSGDSIFAVTEVTIDAGSVSFYPSSVLNAMRRSVLTLLEEERMKRYERALHTIEKNTVPYPAAVLDYTANIANSLSEAFYRRHGVKEIEPAFELRHDVAGTTVMTTKHCLKFQFGMCEGKRKEHGDGGANDDSQLFLSDNKRTYRLEFDCDECMMKIIIDGK